MAHLVLAAGTSAEDHCHAHNIPKWSQLRRCSHNKGDAPISEACEKEREPLAPITCPPNQSTGAKLGDSSPQQVAASVQLDTPGEVARKKPAFWPSGEITPLPDPSTIAGLMQLGTLELRVQVSVGDGGKTRSWVGAEEASPDSKAAPRSLSSP